MTRPARPASSVTSLTASATAVPLGLSASPGRVMCSPRSPPNGRPSPRSSSAKNATRHAAGGAASKAAARAAAARRGEERAGRSGEAAGAGPQTHHMFSPFCREAGRPAAAPRRLAPSCCTGLHHPVRPAGLLPMDKPGSDAAPATPGLRGVRGERDALRMSPSCTGCTACLCSAALPRCRDAFGGPRRVSSPSNPRWLRSGGRRGGAGLSCDGSPRCRAMLVISLYTHHVRARGAAPVPPAVRRTWPPPGAPP